MSKETDQLKPLIRTRQIRQFTDEPVSDADLTALAEVARWTGSSRNSQPWRFIVVRDGPLIRRLAEIGMPQTGALHSATAALAISIRNDEASAISHSYDDGRVAERVLIGASMLGLGAGITWVRSEVRAEIGALLGVEDGRFVRTIMAVGHPSEEGLAPKSAPGQARLPLDELLDWR